MHQRKVPSPSGTSPQCVRSPAKGPPLLTVSASATGGVAAPLRGEMERRNWGRDLEAGGSFITRPTTRHPSFRPKLSSSSIDLGKSLNILPRVTPRTSSLYSPHSSTNQSPRLIWPSLTKTVTALPLLTASSSTTSSSSLPTVLVTSRLQINYSPDGSQVDSAAFLIAQPRPLQDVLFKTLKLWVEAVSWGANTPTPSLLRSRLVYPRLVY
jgi:hypothetical protein